GGGIGFRDPRYFRYCDTVAGVSLSVLTRPLSPSDLPGRPSIEYANAPASPISTTASRAIACVACSPDLSTRANTFRPSIVNEIQQSAVGCTSSCIVPATPDGLPASDGRAGGPAGAR